MPLQNPKKVTVRRAEPTSGHDLVIKGATVIDCSGRAPFGPVDVEIIGGRIGSITDTAVAQTAVETLDASGKYLMPGLWETEAHLTRYSNGIRSQMAIDWYVDGDPRRVESSLRSYLAHGITSVVDLGGPPEVLAPLRERQRRGEVTGARVLMVGRQYTAIGGQPIVGGRQLRSVIQEVAGPEQARTLLRQAIAEYDLDAVKVNYTVGGPPLGDAPIISRQTLAALVQEAHIHDLAVMVHIDDADAAVDALEAGVDNIEHMFRPRAGRLRDDVDRVTQLCLTTGAYWPFTLATWESFARAGDPAYLDELHLERLLPAGVRDELEHSPESVWHVVGDEHRRRYIDRFNAAMEFVAPVHAAGVKMTMATDSGNPMVFHGPSAIRELELTVRAGVGCADALMAATSVSAEKMRYDTDLGTVAPGKIADLLLLDGDPLEDISNVRRIDAVIQGGAVHRPDDLVASA